MRPPAPSSLVPVLAPVSAAPHGAAGADSSPLWCGLIPGEPASKANSRRQVARKSLEGKWFVASIKSAKALSYASRAIEELAIIKPTEPIECELILHCWIWYASRRPDLDESLVMDVLQKGGIIKNDRQIKEKHIFWRLDKDNPRSLVTLSSMAA